MSDVIEMHRTTNKPYACAQGLLLPTDALHGRARSM
jgi:hypothetical protein